MKTELETTTGVMLDVPTYNRLRAADEFCESGPKGERIVVTLVDYEQQFGLSVPPSTTIQQLAACLAALSGRTSYDMRLLRSADGALLEPERTLSDCRIKTGSRLFGEFRRTFATCRAPGGKCANVECRHHECLYPADSRRD